MNVLMFVLLTMSILLTLTGARENRRKIIVGGSWTYAMSLLTALGDILIRLSMVIPLACLIYIPACCGYILRWPS